MREPEKCLSVVREESVLPCVKSERTSSNSEFFISVSTILCGFLCVSVLPLVAVSNVKKIPNTITVYDPPMSETKTKEEDERTCFLVFAF